MFKVRCGAFETNSSSTHALIWSTDDYLDRDYQLEGNVGFDYYGRCLHMYSEPLDKLGYIWTAVNALGLDASDWENYLTDLFGPKVTFEKAMDTTGLYAGIDHLDFITDFITFMRENPEHLYHFVLGAGYLETSEYDGPLLFFMRKYMDSDTITNIRTPTGENSYLYGYIKEN